MNRKFINTTNDKDDRRRRDPHVKAKLRNCHSAEDAEDIEDIVDSEPMAANRWSWDNRRIYPSNAAQRWLKAQAKAKLKWDDVRPLLIEKVGDVERADDMVEITEMIDGELHTISHYFGPTAIKDHYNNDMVLVKPDGTLMHHLRPKRAGSPPKRYFLIGKNEIWFKLENETIFHAPLVAVTELSEFHQLREFRQSTPTRRLGYIYTGYDRKLPQLLQDKEILLKNAKQVSTKKAPEGVADLQPIVPPEKSQRFIRILPPKK